MSNLDTKNLDAAIAAITSAASGGSRLNELMAKGAGGMTAQERAELAALLASPTDAATASAVGKVTEAVEPFTKSATAGGDSVDATQFILGIQHGVEGALRFFGEALAKSQSSQVDTLSALAAGIKVLMLQSKGLTAEVQALTKSVTALEESPAALPLAAHPNAPAQPGRKVEPLRRSFKQPGEQPAGPTKQQIQGAIGELIKSNKATVHDIAAFETSGQIRESLKGLIDAQLQS